MLLCSGISAVVLAGCATPPWLAYHPLPHARPADTHQPPPIEETNGPHAPVWAAIPGPAMAPSLASNDTSQASPQTNPGPTPTNPSPLAPAQTSPSQPPPKFIVTPVTTPSGKVVRVNENARFAVLNFPVGTMPVLESRLNVYRRGLKVGEVKVTGPQQDDNTVADIVTGEVQVGDELRIN